MNWRRYAAGGAGAAAWLGALALPRQVYVFYKFRGLAETSPIFRAKLAAGALRRGLDPNSLAAVMAIETGGTFSPRATNPSSGATGLIQWIPQYAPGGVDALRRMTATEQLALVFDHFDKAGIKKGASMGDYYLAVFAPAHIGYGLSHVVYAGGTPEYEANSGVDVDGDGDITTGDAQALMGSVYGAAEARGRVFAMIDPWRRTRALLGATGSALAAGAIRG